MNICVCIHNDLKTGTFSLYQENMFFLSVRVFLVGSNALMFCSNDVYYLTLTTSSMLHNYSLQQNSYGLHCLWLHFFGYNCYGSIQLHQCCHLSWWTVFSVSYCTTQYVSQLVPEYFSSDCIQEKVDSKSGNVQCTGVLLAYLHARLWQCYDITSHQFPQYEMYENWQVRQYVACWN